MGRFNLIATTLRGQETVGMAELNDLLASLGDPAPKVSTTRIAGLLTAYTSLDPFTVVEKVREIMDVEPWRIGNIMRLIPVEEVVESRLERIAETVEKLAAKIPEDATYRVTVEKRHTTLSSKDIIEAAAGRVSRKVSLENPEWIVLIEVLGGVTGVSALKPEQILSMTKRR